MNNSIKMSEQLMVSFVIPTYNSEKYLEECILSILNQNYANIEIILIDGLSDDNTIMIANKYQKNIKKIISEKDDGIYDAINKGILNCSGELIKILNSDDKLTSNSLKRAVDAYNSNKASCGDNFIILSRIERINLNGLIVGLWGKRNNVFFFENLLHPSWYVPKTIYNKLGLYSLNYKIASDYDYFLKLKKNKIKLLKSKAPYVQYREGGTSHGFTGKNEVYEIKKIYKGQVLAFLLRLQLNLSQILIRLKSFL